MKKLTRRQKQVLAKLIELYRVLGEPIHYPALAEHLGVGKVTVYEMLRILEDRGYVDAEYQRPEDAQGPGRPAVYFRPTASATAILAEGVQKGSIPVDWERTRIKILERVRAAKRKDYEGAIEEMVAHLADQPPPIEYLAGMVAAIMLGLQSLKESIGAKGIRRILKSIGLPGETGLTALGGLSVGLSLVEQWNQRVTQAFLEHVTRYQSMLAELSAENRHRLSQFTHEVLKIVSG
jgi:DNA-binding MarR family transcriptional regulator